MIRTLLVDDEPPARDGLRVRLQDERDIEIVGEAADGIAAVEAIGRFLPDLVFLDIQMPGIDGFEVVARAGRTHLPSVVFVTAFDRYALRAFEVHALDYLLKPVSGQRLTRALDRVRHELSRDEQAERGRSKVAALLDARERGESGASPAPAIRWAVKEGDRYVLLRADEVDWIEAAANYVRFHSRATCYLMRGTLSALERSLDPARFVRIHRSTIVNVDRVKEIKPEWHGDFEVVLTGGKALRMSRNFRGALLP
ncbi:MAG: LytTR family transcriptional regulator DNA-binding domain-containing protein [Gemmatimonadota bacterium]